MASMVSSENRSVLREWVCDPDRTDGIVLVSSCTHLCPNQVCGAELSLLLSVWHWECRDCGCSQQMMLSFSGGRSGHLVVWIQDLRKLWRFSWVAAAQTAV
jgi:hypothetical protein